MRTFLKKLVDEFFRDNVLSLANELTYKLLLASFPFLIFLITLVGFMNLDADMFIQQVSLAFPENIAHFIETIVVEVVDARHGAVMSFSLLFAVYSSSSGFCAIMRGINLAYGFEDKRGFIRSRIIAVLASGIFALCFILSLLVLVFGDKLLTLIPFNLPSWTDYLFGIGRYLLAMVLLNIIVALIYKISVSERVSFMSVMPGALFTAVIWVVSTKLFNIYVNNFSRFSLTYGSIASVFIMIFWLNIISIILLLGGEINAVLRIMETERKKLEHA